MKLADFPRYDSYSQPSSSCLAFPVPSHWSSTKARFLFQFSKGLTITKANLEEKGIPCVNYGEIHSKFGFAVNPEINELKCVSPDFLKSNGASLLQKGDFVFADTSEDIEGSGNFTHLASDTPTFAGYHTIIARPDTRAETKYLAYILDSTAFREQVQRSVNGVKVYSISQGLLKNLKIFLPPLHEQRAIAAFLDEKCSKIDEAVRIREEQIALLRERRQILIQQAVTRGLNPDAPMKDSGITWIGQMPAHWEEKRLKDLGESIIGLTYDPRNLCDKASGILVLRSSNLKDGQFVYDDDLNVYVRMRIPERLFLKNNDILICSRNGSRNLIGKCAIVGNKDAGATFGAFTTVFRSTMSRYIFQIMNSEIFKMLAGSFLTSTINQLTISNLNSIAVPVPPEKERASISEFLENASIQIEDAISVKQSQIAALKEYKVIIINSAVTGKIKVT